MHAKICPLKSLLTVNSEKIKRLRFDNSCYNNKNNNVIIVYDRSKYISTK